MSTTPTFTTANPLEWDGTQAASTDVPSAPTRTESAAQTQRVVECRWLLALYAVVPLSLAIVAIDVFFLDRAMLREFLPSEPERWAFWAVVFNLPHIVASFITMADREYLSHYRRSLLWPAVAFLGISVAGYVGPQPISYQLLFIFIAVYTVIHVFAQQLGLTLMMMSTAPSRLFKTWRVLAIAAGLAVYTLLYAPYRLLNVDFGFARSDEVLGYIAIALSVAVAALAFPLMRQSRTRIGVLYMWANVAMVVSVCFMNEIGYTLFVVLVPRVIHDVTAFIVYVTHDTNRNRSAPRNALYRLSRGRIPPIVLLPLASIALAYVLTSNQRFTAVSVVILTISFLHYYFEGFIWRGANPHRQFLSFRR